MAVGTVKFYNNDKGYGFLIGEQGEDVFVHYSNLVGDDYVSLNDGQMVEFEIGSGPNGPQAVNVVVI